MRRLIDNGTTPPARLPHIGHYGEEIGCVVLELGYFIDFKNKKLEDPLSVTLSLTESEKQDN